MARTAIAARLARKWRATPQAQVHAVIRTIADLDEAQLTLEQRGLKIVHRYKLLPSLAVVGTAHDLLALANEDWITKIEEDQQVHTA